MSLKTIKRNLNETDNAIIQYCVFQFENSSQLTQITITKTFIKQNHTFIYVLEQHKYTKGKLEESYSTSDTLRKARNNLKITGTFESNLY
jgi:hypothetical protein